MHRHGNQPGGEGKGEWSMCLCVQQELPTHEMRVSHRVMVSRSSHFSVRTARNIGPRLLLSTVALSERAKIVVKMT